ncbi:hypothetical protein V8C42DRAFT_339899 [Trichoderma barbatum]
MSRRKQISGQKRISDFFQKKAAPEPAASSSGMKRGFVDETAEEVVSTSAVPPNKRQMTSASLSGGGHPGQVNLENKSVPSLTRQTAQIGGNAIDLDDKTEERMIVDSEDESDRSLSPIIPSAKAKIVPSAKAKIVPSAKAKTTLGSPKAIPNSEDELDDDLSIETSTDEALACLISAAKSLAVEQESSDISMVLDHYEDESDEEANCIDNANALIEDDEYIPFEDDEEDDDIAARLSAAEVEPVAHSNNETVRGIFEPPHGRHRVESGEVNAAEWVKRYDESHPVDKDDEDLQRFEANFTGLIECMTQWAAEVAGADWHKLPRGQREMTRGFHSLFRRAAANPAGLARICLDGMPQQVRKVLGKEDLSEIDFLNLPTIPALCKHRLVYVDVATRLHQEQVKKEVRDGGYGPKSFKAPTSSCDVKDALEAKLYVGSSVNKLGSYNRIREHEAIANGHFKTRMNLHYSEVSQPNVLCNFRLLGVWQNPYANKSYEGQDSTRWIAVMVEGLIMAYLNLYTEANIGYGADWLFTASSYKLVGRVRNGIPLPDFSGSSLNRAWSISQGTSSSAKLVQLCANPECRRPRALSETTLVGTRPAKVFVSFASDDLLAPYYCQGCELYHRNHKTLRVREGLPTGRWRHETDFEAINLAWFGAGHDRKCHNAGCNVPIHSAANLYGIENGIKCLRCHEFALLHHQEYAPVYKDGEQIGDCQVCQRQDVRIFCWDKIDLRNDPDLPTELCGGCYATRCSFLQDEIPANPQPKTVAGCGNVACWDMTRKQKAERSSVTLIENINEHIWRCARCDYCHEIGVEKPSKQLENLPKPPIGPIASHRFNATKCIDCARYISYEKWQKVDGGYCCGSCVGLKCSSCNGDPAIYPVRERTDGQDLCYLCHEAHRRGFKGTRQVASQRISATRTCCNVHCTATGSDKTQWFFNPADKSQYHCHRCHKYFKKHGKEWCPDAKCYNQSCTESGTDVKWCTGPDGNTRCRPCNTAFSITKAERPLRATCHNFGICGHDYTNFSKGFTCDGKGDGNVRCSECHRYWVDYGRQYEKDPNLPRLTKAQLKARVCSRPGCNARKSEPRWYRWKDFVPNGWLCHSCFKPTKAAHEQNNGAANAADTTAAGTATAASQHEDSGGPDAPDGPATNHSEE